MNLVEKSETEIVIEIDTKTIEAPYSDTFSCNETWIVISNPGLKGQCLFSRLMRVHFVSDTIFRG
jgi:hypothetical protein